MKIRSLPTLTRTYVLALSLIAFLTLAIIITMHQVILTQTNSARLINISGSQRWLSQKTALLSVELVYISKLGDRDLLRQQLLGTIAQIQENYQELVTGSTPMISPQQLSPQMQTMYFSPPMIMCDIDFFKAYNDTYGHLLGDECLKKVAVALKSSLKRQGDLVARYGGEEFVVVLPNTNVEGTLIIAETIRANVDDLELPHRLSSVKSNLTISLGVAIGFANSADFPETLIGAADKALYQAKQDGRNRYKLASDSR